MVPGKASHAAAFLEYPSWMDKGENDNEDVTVSTTKFFITHPSPYEVLTSILFSEGALEETVADAQEHTRL